MPWRYFFLIVILICCGSGRHEAMAADTRFGLSAEEVVWISGKVFENECGDEDRCLLEWNTGENFLSLGLGHFIWYPQGVDGPFVESFPDFLKFVQQQSVQIPAWLIVKGGGFADCPWRTKEEFLQSQESKQFLELKTFMKGTRAMQADFLIQRLHNALPEMLDRTPDADKEHVSSQFNRMVGTLVGIYTLVDYINFKGLGIAKTERYQGKGWGLLQVLGEMKGEDPGIPAVEEFGQVAAKILAQRVENSPPERNEARWLKGWRRRVLSYAECAGGSAGTQ